MGTKENIIICFIGGSGGHFIASICEYLLYNLSYNPLNNGSYHNTKIARFIGGILPRDNSSESLAAEYEYILSLTKCPLSLGHVRNVALLRELGWKVIYIDFNNDDHHEIDSRVLKKVNLQKIETITEDQYNMLKGGSWPSWKEYKNGKPAPELDDTYVRLKDHSECTTWQYILPNDSNNICRIEFREIQSGYTILDKLSEFLNIRQFDHETIKKQIDNYRSKQ